jgi:hypothetical protein
MKGGNIMSKLSMQMFENKLVNISTVSEKYHNVKIMYLYDDYLRVEYNSETGNEKIACINRNYIVSIEEILN